MTIFVSMDQILWMIWFVLRWSFGLCCMF